MVVDPCERVVAACAGYPAHDETWLTDVIPGIGRDLDAALGAMDFTGTGCIPAPPGHAKRKRRHRRGDNHKTATKGMSMGGGQQVGHCC